MLCISKNSYKRFILFIFLILFGIAPGFAATYYVSNSGNDSNSGLTISEPWKTLNKVNASSFKPGDQILFKCGDTFFGTITVKNSGSSGNPITFNSYGTGVKPIITGFSTITDWTNEGNGIYSKIVGCESNPSIVTINGVQYGMGRYPNKDNYLTVDSHVSNTSITDADLNSSVTNWKGAEIVLRAQAWVLDRCSITQHSGHTLTYSNLGSKLEPRNGYYYFIQNDLRTLDQFGEWYYNGTKLYMYFGTKTPTNYVVKIPTLNRLIQSLPTMLNYINIENLSLIGSNTDAIYLKPNNYISIKSCDIDFSGGNGIYFWCYNSTVDNTNINHVAMVGIWAIAANETITNNTIKNTGMIEGSTNYGSYSVPIKASSSDALIQYNRIDSCAKAGIFFTGNRAVVKNNFISNTHFLMNDGGGINTDGSQGVETGKIIQGNIVINGFGKSPIAGEANREAIGIYCDSYSHDVLIKDNTVANYSTLLSRAYVFSNSNNMKFQNNTSYNNNSAVYWLEWGSQNALENIKMNSNIFVAKTRSQKILELQSNLGSIIPFGTADSNYYARPIDDNVTMTKFDGATDQNLWKPKTLAQWQTYSGQDIHSHKSPQAITNENDLQFEFNASKISKTISLSMPMIDVKGNKYTTSITLQPYASVVLMKDNNPLKYFTEYKSICEGSTYNGWTKTGKYERTLISKTGADSVVITNLTVHPKYAITENITINEGESYKGWVKSGQYTRNLNSVSGCDSVVTTNLQVALNTTKQADLEFTQSIALIKGYNLISTYVTVQNPDASVVTKPLSDQGSLIKLQDEAGNSLENWGAYGGWINKLGVLENTKGYKILVTNDCTLNVKGKLVTLPLEISLKTGWNIISFPRTDLVNAMNIIQPLIDQNLLQKVQDEAGNSIDNWGLFGGWKNGIGNFVPGKAYKVQMKADAKLTIQENYPKSAVILTQPEKTEYFTTRIEGNGNDQMNINITGLENAGFAIGDELAAFDGDLCVGKLKITEKLLIDRSASLIASFSTDDQIRNGFTEGHPVQIVHWNKLTNTETPMGVSALNGTLNYVRNGSILVKVNSITSSVDRPDHMFQIEVFPNPTQGMFTVRFSRMPDANGTIDILDVSGRKIATRLVTQSSEVFNLEEQAPGLYLVKATMNSKEKIYKLIIN